MALTSPLIVTLQVALTATLVVSVPAVAIGYTLARYEFPGKTLISALVGLPLVLPPTAVGYLWLRLLASNGPLGRETLGIDLHILLTWKAAVVAAATMSIPLVARTARVTFEGIDPRLESMARTLGHGRLRTLLGYTLPMARRGLLAGIILGFTRAVGEFGATYTIAGNIPGRTQTLASAIFSAQQVNQDGRAGWLMVIAIAVGLAAIVSAEILSRQIGRKGATR